MVLDTADGRNTAPRSLAQVDLLWADNSIKNGVEVASDLKIYEADGKTTVAGAYTEKQKDDKAGRFFDEQQVVGNVYKVYTDEDGVITKMVEMISTDKDDIVSGKSYEYNSKLDRLSVADARNASLEDAKALFVVRTDDTAEKSEKAGYIKWDSKTNQDNLESGLYVDPDDVMAVTIDDMPDITSNGADNSAKAMTLDINVDDEQGDAGNGITGWFNDVADATDAQIVLNKNSNDEVSAAVMAVDSFDYFTKGNVTPALLTYVDVSGKGDERQVTVDLAMGGKFQTGVECVKGDDVDDIFDCADLSDVKDTIGNGKYVEVTTNADGKITDINFMTAQADGTMKGNFYTVTRKAVAQKSTKWFSTFADAYFANDEKMYTLDRIEDSKSWDLIDETEFYTIDGTPSVENKSYENHKLAVTDGFEDELANYKNGELKSTKINEEEVDYSVVVSSYTNNKHDDVDEYYVADIVTKNGKQDVEAVFAYDDTLEEAGEAVGVAVTTSNTALTAPKNGTREYTVATWAAMSSTSKTPDLAKSKIVGDAKGVELKGVTGDSDKDVKVTVATGATGSFVVELYAADGTYLGKTKEIKVTATDVAAQEATLDDAQKVIEGKDGVAGSATITPDANQFTGAGKAVTVTVDGKYALTADIPKNATVGQILNLYQKEMRALNIDDKYEYTVNGTQMTITSKVPGQGVKLDSDVATAVSVNETAAVTAVAAKYSAQVTQALHNGSVTVKIAQNGVESIATATTIEELTVENTAKLIADAFADDANFEVTVDSGKVVAKSKTAGAGVITIEVVK